MRASAAGTKRIFSGLSARGRQLPRHIVAEAFLDGEWRIVARTVVIEWVCAADAASSRFSPDPYPDGTWDREDLSYRRPLVVHAD